METTSIPARSSNILVVDDKPANLQVLSEILKKEGYRVRPVPSGKLALAAAETEPPDLILLDIMMPEMDGYEVCRRLKDHAVLTHIPVIFISALDDTTAKIEGFHTGGVDYITKPFQPEEVLARVDAHLTLHRYRNALEEKTRQLEISYGRLQELEDLRDQLTHTIVHDMRNLLMGVGGYLEMMSSLSCEGKADNRCGRYLRSARRSVGDLTAMINNVLDVSRMEANEMVLHLSQCDLTGLIGEAMEKLEATKGARDIRFDAPERPVLVSADCDVLLRIIINLLGNAIKFTDDDGTIVLVVEPRDDRVSFSIRDNGPGIPVEYQERVFEKFGQVKMRQSGHKSSTGLGLTFCKLAVEAHQGRIWVESGTGAGSTFFFEIPGRVDREPCAG